MKTYMRILSTIKDDADLIERILQQIKKENSTGIKKDQIEKKCLDKILPSILLFLEDNMNVRRPNTALLEDNIIEFRISLPQSKQLLRIIAGISPPKICLLSGYIIKPKAYSDTKMKKQIEKEYKNHICQAKKIRDNYLTGKFTDIQDISLYFPIKKEGQ